jgi:hypothetical protein
MARQESNLARDASTAVLAPIGGLVVGLIVGGIRARALRPNEIAQLVCVTKWAVTGSFAGLALVVLLACTSRMSGPVSVRRLMVFVAVAGALAWFFARVLFGAIGYGGF